MALPRCGKPLTELAEFRVSQIAHACGVDAMRMTSDTKPKGFLPTLPAEPEP
jgi:hypothetical protein